MSTGEGPRGVERYLTLRYPIELRELSPEEGGGWMATIPQLGSHTFVGDGGTPEEALAALDEVRRHLIPRLVASGVKLPEPAPEAAAERYSGKLVLRIPSALHAAIADAARQSETSINKLATRYLAEGLARSQTLDELRQAIRTEMQRAIGELRPASDRAVRARNGPDST